MAVDYIWCVLAVTLRVIKSEVAEEREENQRVEAALGEERTNLEEGVVRKRGATAIKEYIEVKLDLIITETHFIVDGKIGDH